ncbi:glycosyl transferase family protein [Marinomonas agarivorans]|nr:glycosyl transferase family protein [Marinomonas agarivorans]
MTTPFIDYIKILARGRQGSRSLTVTEAQNAMTLILNGDIAPEQMGAFWMLIRVREETIDEATGFTQATRHYLRTQQVSELQADLDWPAYAGKRNELPWFLLAALALAQTGIKVAMHGHEFVEDERIYLDQVMRALNLPIADSINAAKQQLAQNNFTYLPLTLFAPKLAELMNLKRLLGLRSPVNTVVRLMNPTNAKHSVHGVFHKGYDTLHIGAAQQLKDPSVLVFCGGNGEAEVNPERQITLGLYKNNSTQTATYWQDWPQATKQHLRQKSNLDVKRLQQHWSGEIVDPFGELAILNTLACILAMQADTADLSNHQSHYQQALTLWQQRDKTQWFMQSMDKAV